MDLGKDKISTLLKAFTIPCIISMLVTSIYNIADTYFVSNIGGGAAGAVGVVFPLMAIVQAIGFTFGMGASSMISSKLGESHFVYPFIADAPFSAYGRNFINNFLEAVPAVFNQSIILIKELYDVNAQTLITDDGNKLLDRLKDGEIEGSFYVNSIINDEGATLVDGKGDRITQTTKIEQRKAPRYE